MSTAVQRRRGTAAENNAFTGLEGEISVDTTNDALRVHDGSTAGGFATVMLPATFATPGTGISTFLATPSSANLRAALTDETGTGAAVFGTSPTLTTPVLSGAVTGTYTLGASGAGVTSIFFGTGTSGLDSYATTTWTPADASGAGLAFSNVNGTYVKIGRFVMATGRVTYPATADATAAAIGGLPFTTGTGSAPGAVLIGFSNYGSGLYGLVATSNTIFNWTDLSGTNLANSALSTRDFRFTVIYRSAS